LAVDVLLGSSWNSASLRSCPGPMTGDSGQRAVPLCPDAVGQGDDAGVDALDRGVCKMPTGDKLGFVSTVVSNGTDKVCGDLLVSWRRSSAMSEILGRPEGLDLTQFESFCFLPLAISILAVNINGLLMVARDSIAAHTNWCRTV